MKLSAKALAIVLLFVGLVLVNYLASSLPAPVETLHGERRERRPPMVVRSDSMHRPTAPLKFLNPIGNSVGLFDQWVPPVGASWKSVAV